MKLLGTKITAWRRYPLTRAAYFVRERWRQALWCHVLTVGPLGLAVIWRENIEEKKNADAP